MSKIGWNYQTRAICIAAIILLITAGVFFLLVPVGERTIVNGFTIFGTPLSLYGIAIAYLQIGSVRKINKVIEEEVRASTAKKDMLLSVSDIQKAISIINYINDKINNEKYELAQLKIGDLREIVVSIKCKKNFNEYVPENYGSHLSNLTDDIGSINNYIRNNNNMLNLELISRHLTNLSGALIEIENKLKNN
jgi:hypothetical protein